MDYGTIWVLCLLVMSRVKFLYNVDKNKMESTVHSRNKTKYKVATKYNWLENITTSKTNVTITRTNLSFSGSHQVQHWIIVTKSSQMSRTPKLLTRQKTVAISCSPFGSGRQKIATKDRIESHYI